MKSMTIINTGSGKNIGDRAMLINMIRIFRTCGVANINTPSSLPSEFSEEFSTNPYTTFYQCVGRFSSLNKIPLIGYFFFMLFVFLDALFCVCMAILIKVFDLKLKSNFSEFDMLNAISSSEYFVFTGGGYLTDKGMFECRCCLFMAILALILKRKVVFTGQGLGPFYSALTNFMLRYVVSRSQCCFLRDSNESVQVLYDLKINKEKAIVAGDDALSLTLSNESKNLLNEESKKIQIAVHLRISPFTENIDSIKLDIENLVNLMFDNSWYPVFFIFASQDSWEREYLNSLLKIRRSTEYQIFSDPDPRVIKSRISECDIAIGVAYHFIIFALTTGVPVLALYGGAYYKQKMNGVLEFFNKQEWLVSFDKFESQKVFERLNDMYCNRESVTVDLVEKTDFYAKEHYEKIRCLFHDH
jgi:polysaccharide pyruvyl transferase WcaK-like protein